MFSGGVGEYVYGREERDFGDMGRRLGHAIRARIDARRAALAAAAGRRMHPRDRARRIGIFRAAFRAIPATSRTPGALLPRRNLQVLQPPFDCRPKRSTPTRGQGDPPPHRGLRRRRRPRDRAGVALDGPPAYERIAAFAEGIGAASPTASRRESRSTSCSTATWRRRSAPPARGARGRRAKSSSSTASC